MQLSDASGAPNRSYISQVYRLACGGFDHLYRFSALFDRVGGGDQQLIIYSHYAATHGR